MKYEMGKDPKLIQESVNLILESRQTEYQVFAYFKKHGIKDEVSQKAIEYFRTSDKTKNQLLMMPMGKAVMEKGMSSMEIILSIFERASELVNNMKIPMPQVDDEFFYIGDKKFENFDKFSEYINDYEHLSKGYSEQKSDIVVKTDDKPLFPENQEEDKSGIMIYDGNDVGRCIYYGRGGLTGKVYGHCIGLPGNTNWQSYRDVRGSTFYYIFDKVRSFDDPLHLVIADCQSNGDIELFDVNNTPGRIKEYGENFQGYLNELKSRGVPVDKILVNKPKTPEEENDKKKIGNRIIDLNRFKGLSYKDKSKYIGRGHELTDEQFSYLWKYRKNSGAYYLIKQYLNIGKALPIYQFKLLTGEN